MFARLAPTVRRRAPRDLAVIAAAIIAAACASAPSTPTDDFKPSEFAPSLGINLAEYSRMPEGVLYKDIRIGDGAVADSRSKVTVTYRGLLTSGVQVDSSIGFTFKMGSGSVIRGWQIGVQGMRVGGARILIIPAYLGYGWKEVGAVPPNSTLLFNVSLVKVE